MKKTYQLKNLGCASCALTMGKEIEKLEGVESAKVNFMLRKLTITGDQPEKEDLQRIISSIEPDCRIL